VLEMGEPIRIVELAETMIRLSGLEPGRDIAIEMSARAPARIPGGVLNPTSGAQPTPAQKIIRAERIRSPGLGQGDLRSHQSARAEGDAATLAGHVSKLDAQRASAGASFDAPDGVVTRALQMVTVPFALSLIP